MNGECNIVKDLLPLYLEDMLSDDSKKFVEEHIKSCPDCALELEKLGAGAENETQEENRGDEALLLKDVKRKIRRKRLLIVLATVAATVALLFGYIMLRPVEIDYGESEVFTRAEMEAAVKAVRLDFAKMFGCKLFSLSYAGDEECAKELERQNKHRDEEEKYTQCIVFDSVFRSPVTGGGAWSANRIYTWNWTLARTDGGPWTVIGKGYC